MLWSGRIGCAFGSRPGCETIRATRGLPAALNGRSGRAWCTGLCGGGRRLARCGRSREGDENLRMSGGPATNLRKPRADAVRNRERVLEAAKAVFSAGGPDASLEAVARRAGV